MRFYICEQNRQLVLAVSPLIGLVGTVVGMLFALNRIETEPMWETVLNAVGLSLGITGISVLGLMLAVRSRR
jgi:biopolymer transport protein ExbB/TolQ